MIARGPIGLSAIVLLPLVALIPALGCAAYDPERPVLKERPWWVRAPGPTYLVALLGTVYVPPGELPRYSRPLAGAGALSPLDAAALEHERVHLRSQRALGEPWWEVRYALSLEVRWAEESRAYEAELLYLRARGYLVPRERILAVVLAEGYGPMVDRSSAEAWYAGLPAVVREIPPPSALAARGAAGGVEAVHILADYPHGF